MTKHLHRHATSGMPTTSPGLSTVTAPSSEVKMMEILANAEKKDTMRTGGEGEGEGEEGEVAGAAEIELQIKGQVAEEGE